jgi:Spy/CpxP family protein refolding chaperone
VVVGPLAIAAIPLISAGADTTVQPSPPPIWPPSDEGPPKQQLAPAPKEAAASDANDIVQLVDEALSKIALRDDQAEALQKNAADVDAKVGAVDEARIAVLVAMAKQVEAGRINADAVRAEVNKVIEAANPASVSVRKGLEKVHDVLSAEQRKLFVSGFRAALEARASMLDSKAQIQEWSKKLSLTDEQKQKIQAIYSEDTVAEDVGRARVELVLAAFLDDTFSLDDLVPASAVRARTEHMMARMERIAAEVMGILTPEQRKAAAAAIRAEVTQTAAGGSEETGQTTSGTGQTSSSLDGTASTAQALWVGRGGYYARSYGRGYSYGFRRGYSTGFGGVYLI